MIADKHSTDVLATLSGIIWSMMFGGLVGFALAVVQHHRRNSLRNKELAQKFVADVNNANIEFQGTEAKKYNKIIEHRRIASIANQGE